MTLGELARFMRSLGCSQALNLDGGGSSTFYFEGQVRNSPSDFGKERPVSDAIVFIQKAAGEPCGLAPRRQDAKDSNFWQ
ncbi:MAG: phosphodiester glycosidase family protein [Acidobacteriota bacterium]